MDARKVGESKMMVQEEVEGMFETADQVIASFLYCRNFSIVEFKTLSDGTTLFVFADSDELRCAIVDYANDGVVPVRTFCATLRHLEAIARERFHDRRP